MATSDKSGAKKAAATPAKKPATKPAKAAKAAAPAVKEPAAKKPPASKAAKPASRKTGKARTVDPQVRRNYVEVAAYYIAERRGFTGGCAQEDWLQAEVEIDQLLADNKLSA